MNRILMSPPVPKCFRATFSIWCETSVYYSVYIQYVDYATLCHIFSVQCTEKVKCLGYVVSPIHPNPPTLSEQHYKKTPQNNRVSLGKNQSHICDTYNGILSTNMQYSTYIVPHHTRTMYCWSGSCALKRSTRQAMVICSSSKSSGSGGSTGWSAWSFTRGDSSLNRASAWGGR